MSAENPLPEGIRHLLGRANFRMTPTDLMRTLMARFPARSRAEVRLAIRQLVAGGELIYSHHLSTTQLELNCRDCFKVSPRLAINATAVDSPIIANSLVIRMPDAAVFGIGDHPTTRLALQAVDRLSLHLHAEKAGRCMVLDIGTGTGILAIAAVLLGMSRAVALDTDMRACREAVKNIRLNGLGHAIQVVAGTLDSLGAMRFDFILANLRPPTLISLMPQMAVRTAASGCWVLSGFRPEHAGTLETKLPAGFRTIWTQENQNWSVLVVRRV